MDPPTASHPPRFRPGLVDSPHQVPISRLPQELLTIIFQLCLDWWKPGNDLTRLRLVCTAWKSIVDSTPPIWTSIKAADGLPHACNAITKTRESPVDLILLTDDPVSLDEFLAAVGPKVPHWRSVDLDFEVPPTSLGGLQTSSCFSLEKLSLSWETGDTFEPTLPFVLFDGGPAPTALKDLFLFRFPVELAPMQLSNLLSLALVDVPRTAMDDLLLILDNSPTLLKLRLQDLRGLRIPGAQSPILLESLTTCDLDLPIPSIRFLLSVVHAPSLDHLELTCDLEDSNAHTSIFSPPISGLVPTLKRLISPAKRIEVEFGPLGPHSITFGGLEIVIDTSDLDEFVYFKDLLDFLTGCCGEGGKDKKVLLHLDAVDPTMENLLVFNRCPMMEELTLSQRSWSDFIPLKAIEALGTHIATGVIDKLEAAFDERYGPVQPTQQSAEKTFEESELMVGEFTDFRAAFEDSVWVKTIQWIRKRNSLISIHRLPLELLQNIFHLVLFSSTGRRRSRYFAQLTTLRSVSWLWRNMIQQTPSLWTQLSSTDQPAFISEALENSRESPLHLKYVGKSETLEQESSAFLEKTFSHLPRWEYIAIQDPADDIIKKYFSTPAPSLKSLSICTRMPWVTDGPSPLEALFGGELAGLEELRALLWKEIDWMGFHCRRLRIMEVGGYSMLNMDVLFHILRENPDLQVLLLHFITFCSYHEATQEYDPIILHKVTQFTLRCVAEMHERYDDTKLWDVPVIRILRRIRTPACISFALEVASSTNSTDIFSHIPSPVDLFTRADEQASSPTVPVVRLSFCDRCLQGRAFGSPGSSFKYEITLQNISRNVLTSWVRQEFNPEKWAASKLTIYLEYLLDEDQPGIDDIFELQDWDSVVELDVTGVPYATVPMGLGLMQKLECPQTTTSGIMTGPFLGLQTLRLSRCAVPGEEVLRMVNERFNRITNRPGKISEKIQPDAAGGLTIILGDGMNEFPGSINRDIGAAPGVKEVQIISANDLNLQSPGGSSGSSESDWSPPPPSSTHGSDDGPEAELEFGLGQDSDLSGEE
ncbi:hypothetical protein M407DRAFT_31682 [Tulasnella calospora MUT 4182]|uniref:F-box domain-containing protein n=1 Tax=Tulasnella calospora MUT 4182 TaxID=1051891 RepID=A0A0C3Q589_9AGAM|nr:hypothetical protein M407DRAFT_31682 [Tulasnella calospora MUT 4182]